MRLVISAKLQVTLIELEESMRQGVCKITMSLLLLLVAVVLFGCGSGGVLDEPDRYDGYLTVKDGDEAKLTIDTVQDMCDTDPEDFYDAFAEISITVDAGAPALTLDHYTLEYFPLSSEDGTHRLVMPPALDSPGRGYYNFTANSNTTSSFTITLLSIDTKQEFEFLKDQDPATYGNLDIARYRMRVTLYFTDEYGEDRSITLEQTVYLGDYNNC